MASDQDFQNAAQVSSVKAESSDILSQIKAMEAMDASGTLSTAWKSTKFIDDGVPDLSGGVIPANVITFPAGLGDDPRQPYFMTYVPMKITSAVGGTMGDMSFATTTITKDNLAQVALPIPTGINVAYAQGWEQTDVSAVQGAVMNSGAFNSAAASFKDLSQAGSMTINEGIEAGIRAGGQGVDVVAGKIQASGGGLGGAVSALGEAAVAGVSGGMGAVSAIMSKIGQTGISGNAVAGIALGTAGKLLGPAMSTAAGFASFSQVMAHYSGPAFRNFNFTYNLRPLDPKDQQNIVKMVNFFKMASAPSQISNGLFRIYEIPYVFKISFFSRNGELQDVNKIAHCACTSVAVSYGGDRFNTFSGTDSPIETSLTLSFKEIELITRAEMEMGY